jgi:drug/metabolite transporter (DMT)-like permease
MIHRLNRRVLKADACLLLTAAIWGSAFVPQRVAMQFLGPYTFTGVRFALGALILLPFAVRGGGFARSGGGFDKRVVWGGLFLGAALSAGIIFQQVGLQYTTAGKAGFITGLYVVIVPLLGLFLGINPGSGGWVGVALSAVGLYLLSVIKTFTLAPGDLLQLIGAFFWAVHIIIIGWLSPKVNPLRLAVFQYVFCAVLNSALAAFLETITRAGLYGAMPSILYTGVLSVGLAYTLQVVAQKDSPNVHAAIILSLEGTFAALSGWLILGETMTPRMIVGCALMLAGMLVVQLWPKPSGLTPLEAVEAEI